MAWHYFTENREKIGPITSTELKQLVLQGTVTPDTFVEDPAGRTGLAKDVNGLKFPEAETSIPEPFIATPSPFVPTAQVVSQLHDETDTSQALATQVGIWVRKVVGGKILDFVFPDTIFTPPFDPISKVLVSGSGKGNPALFLWWAMWLLGPMILFPCWIGAVLYEYGECIVMEQDVITFIQALFLGVLGLPVTLIWGLVPGAIWHRSIAGTHIQVDGCGIAGKGVGKGFLWGDARLFGFRLAYNQITSVDVAGSTIIVHASGTQYKCYVANPAEIQRIIVEQQRKSS